MNDTPAQPFPLDFEALRKGDVIAPEVIEAAYRVSRADRNYQLATMKLKERIERDLEARGYPVTIKQEKDALRILTDPEAVEYNDAAFKASLRAIGRAHHRLCVVDTEQLTEQERRAHSRAVMGQAMQIAGMRNARKVLASQDNPELLDP
jgi:hypothetical protein